MQAPYVWAHERRAAVERLLEASCTRKCPERRDAVDGELEAATTLEDQKTDRKCPAEAAPWARRDSNPNLRKLEQTGRTDSTESPRWNQQLALGPS